MEAAILGCGPAGLAAAVTAVRMGLKTTVISSRLEPSHLYGCQYLHAPIPGYEYAPQARVRYSLRGTAIQYRQKVYGDAWAGKVSPEDFIGEHTAWDIRRTYAWMWSDVFTRYDVPLLKIRMDAGMAEAAARDYDIVISTIPAPAICLRPDRHHFPSHTIFANGSTEAQSLRNEIICDGTSGESWYRMSSVFGFATIEWPASVCRNPDGSYRSMPPKWSVEVRKPLSTDCDCLPGIVRAGRYGEWRKSRLVHEVPGIVVHAVTGAGGVPE